MVRLFTVLVALTLTTNSFAPPSKTIPKTSITKEIKLRFDNVSPEFSDKIYEMADSLGTKAEYLMAVFHVETCGTFSPSIRNKNTGATGLIQFLNSTAKYYGTNTLELAKMTDIEQLEYVFKYFKKIKQYRGELSTLEDVYMAVHYPAAVGKSKYLVLYKEGSDAYLFNKSNDLNKDGKVTKLEISYIVRKIYKKYYYDIRGKI